MREILFRGKRIDNGEWVEGAYYLEPYTDKAYIIRWNSMGMGFNEFVEVEGDTIGQYTGLKDKNGQHIFEGDIVDHCYQKGFFNRGVVMWDSQNARFAHELRSMSPAFFMHNPEAWEVIGNIHDNPELLNEVR